MQRRHLTPILVVIFSLLVAATPAYLSVDIFTALLGDVLTPSDPMLDPNEPRPCLPGGDPPPPDGPATSHGNFDQPDMFSGTASFTYELKLPPGTNNMAPKLALVYRSSGGNGWFGMGWELEGLGCIEYSQKNGVPKYDGTDREFTLNMAGTIYELVPDESNIYSTGDTSNIGYYHTKCETWLKIYYDGTYWTVTDKNGVQYRFGYTADSKVPIVDHTFKRLWALDQVLDKHGNYMTYTYILDAVNGEYYPSEITYTRNTNDPSISKIKTVSFLRATRTDNIRPAARWMTHRISEIQVRVDGALVDKYTFTYRYSNCTYRSLLATINRYGTGTVPETTTLTYAADSGSLTSGSPITNYFLPVFGDIDGDGLTDSIIHYPTPSVALNNGDGTFRTVTPPGANWPRRDDKLVDINGDGKIDYFKWGRKDLVYINNWPNDWVRNSNWDLIDNGYNYYNHAENDFNNDGITDYMCLWNGYHIHLSDVSADCYTIRTDYLRAPRDFYFRYGDEDIYIIPKWPDYDGDGYPDMHYSESYYASNYIGMNRENGSIRVWQSDSRWSVPCDAVYYDLDGDGLTDFYRDGYEDRVAVINNGHGFSSKTWAMNLSFGKDLNNDGLLENDGWIRLPNGNYLGGGIISESEYSLININDDPFLDYVRHDDPYHKLSNAKPDLLTQVKLPTGGKVSYEYKRVPFRPIQDGRQLGATWRQYVVSKITTDEGTGRPDSVYASTFDYPPEGGKHARREKTTLGFEWVKKTLPDGSYVKTYFNQCVETAGRMEAVETYTAEGQLIQKQDNEWELHAMQGSPAGYAIILKEQHTYWYPSIGDQIHSRTNFDYDLYSNPVTESRLGDLAVTGDEVTLVKEFINVNQGTDYFVGLPKREKAVAHDGAVLADKLLWYDGQSYGQVMKGLVTEEKSWLDYFAGAATCTDETFYAANGVRPSVNPQDPHPLVTYGYDTYGNRTTVTRHNVRPDGTYEDQVETVVYDADAHALPVEQINPLAQSITRTWDYGLGQPLSETDPNGAMKQMVYDALGRIWKEYSPRNPNKANPPTVEYIYTNALTGNPSTQYVRINHQVEVGTNEYLWTEQYLDGFGRVWKERKQAPEGRMAIREQQYEWHGYKGREWLPYFDGSLRPEETKTSTFDAFRRRVSVTMPDGASTTYAYDTLTTTITVANDADSTGDQVTRQTKDVYDRVKQVEQVNDDGTYVTTYGYDGLGRQIWLRDAMRNAGSANTETIMTYDSLGRLLSKSDPYNGTQTYQYDSVGNVVKKVDAKNTVHFYEYDLLNRLVAKSYQEDGAPSPIVLSVLAYDEPGSTYGIGRLTSTYTGSSILDAEYDYDADGNIVSTAKHIGGTAYTTQAVYDAMGRVKQLTYPDGSAVDYDYDAEALRRVGPYAIYASWNAAGLPGRVEYGNNTKTAYTYHALNQRLTNLVTRDGSSGIIQSFSYLFDTVGNIRTLTDNVIGTVNGLHTENTTQSFDYDKLNRLTHSSEFGDYTYDRIGNIIIKEDVTFSYNYLDPAHPYCPTDGTSGYEASYDANGNLATKTDKNGIGWRYEYDAENMLTRVWKTPVGGSEALIEEYGYGADGIRKTKTSYVSSQTATTRYVFLGNNVLYEVTGEETARYILANGREIAKATGGSTTVNLLTTNQASVERDLAGLNAHHGEMTHDTTVAWHGSASQKVVCDMLLLATFGGYITNIPVTPGAAYNAQAHVRTDHTLNVRVEIQWLNSSGGTIGTTQGAEISSSAGTWREYTVTGTAPTGAAYARINVYARYGNQGYTIWIDGYQLAQGSSVVPWTYPSPPSVYYTHRDHLGSSSVVTDAAGAVVQWNANHPYGEDWQVSPPGTPNIDKHRFTGKETDEGTGLSYFGARYYDAEVGRFTSVDPLQNGTNWYEYCNSNPLKYIDPNGNSARDVIEAIVLGVYRTMGGIIGCYYGVLLGTGIGGGTGFVLAPEGGPASAGVGAAVGGIVGGFAGAVLGVIAGDAVGKVIINLSNGSGSSNNQNKSTRAKQLQEHNEKMANKVGYKTDSKGNVTNAAVYDENGNMSYRIDMNSGHGYDGAHVHEYTWHQGPNGEWNYTLETRAATETEIVVANSLAL